MKRRNNILRSLNGLARFGGLQNRLVKIESAVPGYDLDNLVETYNEDLTEYKVGYTPEETVVNTVIAGDDLITANDIPSDEMLPVPQNNFDGRVTDVILGETRDIISRVKYEIGEVGPLYASFDSIISDNRSILIKLAPKFKLVENMARLAAYTKSNHFSKKISGEEKSFIKEALEYAIVGALTTVGTYSTQLHFSGHDNSYVDNVPVLKEMDRTFEVLINIFNSESGINLTNIPADENINDVTNLTNDSLYLNDDSIRTTLTDIDKIEGVCDDDKCYVNTIISGLNAGISSPDSISDAVEAGVKPVLENPLDVIQYMNEDTIVDIYALVVACLNPISVLKAITMDTAKITLGFAKDIVDTDYSLEAYSQLQHRMNPYYTRLNDLYYDMKQVNHVGITDVLDQIRSMSSEE